MKIIKAQNPALIAWYTRLVFSFRRECHFVFSPSFDLLNQSWSKASYMQVFGLYFMQSYIGLFYHAILYRNFMTLRQILIQRLIVSQVRSYSFSLLMYSWYSCWTYEWNMISRYWRIYLRTQFLTSNTATRNSEPFSEFLDLYCVLQLCYTYRDVMSCSVYIL